MSDQHPPDLRIVPDPALPDPYAPIVEMLEQWLEDARAGRLRMVAICGECDGEICTEFLAGPAGRVADVVHALNCTIIDLC